MNEWDPKKYPIVTKIVFIDIVDEIDVIFTLHARSEYTKSRKTFVMSDTIRQFGKNDSFLGAFKEYFTKYGVSKEYSMSLNAALADVEWLPLV